MTDKLTCPNGHEGPFTYVEEGYTLMWQVDDVDDDERVIRAWGHYEVAEDPGKNPHLVCGADLRAEPGVYPTYCDAEFPLPEGYTLEFT